MARDTFRRRSARGNSTPDPDAPETPTVENEAVPESAAAAEASAEQETAAVEQEQPAAAKETAEPAAPKKTVHSKRDELVAQMREKRDREAREARGEAEPEAAEEEQETTPVAAAEEGAEEPTGTPVAPRKIKVKVYGQEREITEEEAIAAAQQHFASERNFEESRREREAARADREAARIALAQAEQLRQNTASPQSATPPANQQRQAPTEGEPAAQTRAQGQADPARTRKTVETIRYGDDDEAAEALDTAVSEAIERRLAQQAQHSPDQIADLAVQRVQADQQTRQIYSEFTRLHPEIAANADYAYLAMRKARELCVEEMRNYVHENGDRIDPRWVNYVATEPDANKAFATYSEFRKKGWKLPADTGERAAVALERQLNIRRAEPAPAPVQQGPGGPTPAERRVETRAAEKAVMQQQPRRATVTTRQVQQSPPAPRTTKSVVAGMRQQRGYRF